MRHPKPTAGLALTRILSGGQTGVDRAALDLALELGIPCGGWCPLGRRAEDGIIPTCYPLVETPTADYPQRTEWNVRDADATLVLTYGEPTGGTALTIDITRQLGKPCHVVDLASKARIASVRSWLTNHQVHVINVAGPRESTCPGSYKMARRFLNRLFNDRGQRDAPSSK
jgi:hypothetical protein